MVAPKGGITRGFTVKIHPKRPDRNFGKVIRDFELSYKDAMSNITRESLRMARFRTPTNTGATRAAWTSTGSVTTHKGTAIISNPSQVVTYLNDGTRASPGMFIWSVMKRAVNPRRGWHPGIPPNNMLDEIEKDIEDITFKETLDLPRDTKKSVSRWFR